MLCISRFCVLATSATILPCRAIRVGRHATPAPAAMPCPLHNMRSGRSRHLYCYDCLVPFTDVPAMTLPFKVSIITHHEGERAVVPPAVCEDVAVLLLLQSWHGSRHALTQPPQYTAHRADHCWMCRHTPQACLHVLPI